MLSVIRLALNWLKPGGSAMKRILLAILLTLGLIAPVWADAQADGLQDGRAAMKAGDFGKALRLLMPLAKDGNTGAQNAVGVLYAKGWGVPQNHRMAVDWYRKSAEQRGKAGAAQAVLIRPAMNSIMEGLSPQVRGIRR